MILLVFLKKKEMPKRNSAKLSKVFIELEEAYRPKIDEKAQNLLPKEEYKNQLLYLHKNTKKQLLNSFRTS